jgi:hypothetical protein
MAYASQANREKRDIQWLNSALLQSTKQKFQVTGLDIGLVRRLDVPLAKGGDCFLDIRIKHGTPKGRPTTLDDLEFYRVDFKSNDYEKSSDSTGWPMIMR